MLKRHSLVVATAALAALFLGGCGSDSGGSDAADAPPAGSGVCGEGTPDGLLKEVCDKGTITVSTDPAYPPQSSLDPKTGTYVGFDIDVATEIAKRLGVEVAWESPSWDVITAGSWNDRWQMSVGSMTPTNARQKVLDFSQPYYFTPAVVVVNADNSSVSDLSTDLDGKKIGVCSGCTYEQYLDKSLAINGFDFDFVIDDADIHGYDTDTTALQDLALGDGTRLDAVITSSTTAQGYIDAGNPVKIVGDPVFYEPLSVAIDKSSEADPTSLAAAVDKIVGEMHDDGTLSELSKKWYDGADLTVQK
ncbi:transporter substrate-binding domain-containing protein [Nocardioides sp. CN2-186]|uniref:transporter substrate-binding domain-containing protein n=1 Tax=Nocardioides tweenelious TaxID=3156607 RepID=UPI0032B5F46E